jgi:protein PET100
MATVEIFRFGFYVFFPVYVMFKVGDPEWYVHPFLLRATGSA